MRVNKRALLGIAERLLRLTYGPRSLASMADYTKSTTTAERRAHQTYLRTLDKRAAREPHVRISKKALREIAERLFQHAGEKP